MKIKLENLLRICFFAAILLVAIALFIPIPVKITEILLWIELTSTIGILIYSFMKNRLLLPDFLFGLCFLSLVVNGALTKTSVTSWENGNQSFLIQSISECIGNHYFIISFIITCISLFAQIFITIKGTVRTSETAAKFVLDTMNSKMLETDLNCTYGYITEEDKNKMQSKLKKEISFYSSMDAASKLLIFCAFTNILLFLINLIGGISVQTFIQGIPFLSAVRNVMSVTSVNMFIFTIPMTILELASDLAICSMKQSD